MCFFISLCPAHRRFRVSSFPAASVLCTRVALRLWSISRVALRLIMAGPIRDSRRLIMAVASSARRDSCPMIDVYLKTGDKFDLRETTFQGTFHLAPDCPFSTFRIRLGPFLGCYPDNLECYQGLRGDLFGARILDTDTVRSRDMDVPIYNPVLKPGHHIPDRIPPIILVRIILKSSPVKKSSGNPS